MDSTDLSWPSLDDEYTDEFGVIAPEVYQAASKLWPQARQQALNTLGDEQIGHTLLLKAAAQVTRQRREGSGEIANLRAYLYQTFKRLLWAECKKELRCRAHSGPVQEDLPANPSATVEQIDNYLAVQQALQQMDAWTREVFKLLQLGHSYEEIAAMLCTRAVLVRVKFHKRIKKLRDRLR